MTFELKGQRHDDVPPQSFAGMGLKFKNALLCRQFTVRTDDGESDVAHFVNELVAEYKLGGKVTAKVTRSSQGRLQVMLKFPLDIDRDVAIRLHEELAWAFADR